MTSTRVSSTPEAGFYTVFPSIIPSSLSKSKLRRKDVLYEFCYVLGKIDSGKRETGRYGEDDTEKAVFIARLFGVAV
jgi:hypothetical protein